MVLTAQAAVRDSELVGEGYVETDKHADVSSSV